MNDENMAQRHRHGDAWKYQPLQTADRAWIWGVAVVVAAIWVGIVVWLVS